MFKLLLVALGAAVAQAQYVATWTPFKDNINNYMDFELSLTADAFYTTTYTSADAHEEYGLAVGSAVDVKMYVELFSWYTHTIIFHVVPLKLVPYNQALDYTRPAAKGSNGEAHVYLSGYREITILDVQTEHLENMKTCTASIVDTISKMDSANLIPKCAYNPKTLSKYMDSVWKYNVGNLFGVNEWYGVKPYYSASKVF